MFRVIGGVVVLGFAAYGAARFLKAYRDALTAAQDLRSEASSVAGSKSTAAGGASMGTASS